MSNLYDIAIKKLNIIKDNIDFLPLDDQNIIVEIIDKYLIQMNSYKINDKKINYTSTEIGRIKSSLTSFFNDQFILCMNNSYGQSEGWKHPRSGKIILPKEEYTEFVKNLPSWILNSIKSLSEMRRTQNNALLAIVKTQHDLVKTEALDILLKKQPQLKQFLRCNQ